MDDDLKQLEAELKQLVPAIPSPGIERRIAADLSQVSAVLPWWRIAVLPLAVAAGFAAIFALGQRGAPDPATVSPATPAAATKTVSPGSNGPLQTIQVENLLYEQTEEEVITATGAAARRERLRYVDTITWENPHTRASLTWSVPREEVRVVPVDYQ